METRGCVELPIFFLLMLWTFSFPEVTGSIQKSSPAPHLPHQFFFPEFFISLNIEWIYDLIRCVSEILFTFRGMEENFSRVYCRSSSFFKPTRCNLYFGMMLGDKKDTKAWIDLETRNIVVFDYRSLENI